MENLNDRVNFDLKNLDRIEDVIIPNSKTLIYCHGWAANSGLFSKNFSFPLTYADSLFDWQISSVLFITKIS